VLANAAEITRLNARIHKTFAKRSRNAEAMADWKAACAEFHARYVGLAFPGGYDTVLIGLREDRAEAIDQAIEFMEIDPYFFRSGYMKTKFVRCLKKARLEPEQAARFRAILEAKKAKGGNFGT
jgi:hypothetical protein